MPKGASRNSGSSGEIISHFNAVKVRVDGYGALKLKLFSLDSVNEQQLADIKLEETTNREPRVLANFVEQRAGIEIGVSSINEWFKINRIIIYSAFHAEEYPG